MENIEKLKEAFAKALDIPNELITENFSYGNSKWDSVAHMALVASIENEFDIMLETDDVIDMSSFEKSKDILHKYGIQF